MTARWPFSGEFIHLVAKVNMTIDAEFSSMIG